MPTPDDMSLAKQFLGAGQQTDQPARSIPGTTPPNIGVAPTGGAPTTSTTPTGGTPMPNSEGRPMVSPDQWVLMNRQQRMQWARQQVQRMMSQGNPPTR